MRLGDSIKNSFVAGLILIAPLVVTVFVFRVLVNWSLQFVNPVVQGTRLTQYTANIEFVAQLIATVLIVLAIVVVGYIAQRNVGRRVFGNFGRVVDFIPLVNTIYTSVRRITNSLVERETRYESVVLVEYPREGIYSIGLVTAQSPESVESVTGGPAYNVFLPNSPNPTAGRLVLVPEAQIHEIDMGVRRGMRMIVTTGMGEDEQGLPPIDDELTPGPGSTGVGTSCSG